MKAGNYFVYVISCNDGSFYTGYTTCIEKRMRLHKKGRGARYTQVHGVKELVHQETFVTRKAAMQRERQIKKLSHEEKESLHDKCHTSNTCKMTSVQTSQDT